MPSDAQKQDAPSRSPDPAHSPTQLRALAHRFLVVRLLADLLPALADRGVETIVLKGVALWTAVYAPGERPVADIDLLVRPSSRREAEKVLTELGYRPSPHGGRPVSAAAHHSWSHQPPPGTYDLPVDLHVGLAHRSRYCIDVDELFQRSEPCILDGLHVMRLGIEDTLLHLAIHRSLHAFGYDDDPRGIEDATRWLGAFEVAWPVLQQRAHAWGCVTVLWVLLDSVRRTHGAGIPASVLAAIEPRGLARRYIDVVLENRTGTRRFRWPRVSGWRRRLALMPVVLDTTHRCLLTAADHIISRARDLRSPGKKA